MDILCVNAAHLTFLGLEEKGIVNRELYEYS